MKVNAKGGLMNKVATYLNEHLTGEVLTHEAVIAAESGHIAANETGAIEATGHKVIHTPHVNGKLTP